MSCAPGSSRFDAGAPDVTDAVMRRLGYEKLDASESRKAVRKRRLARASTIALLLGVVLLGGLYERAEREQQATEALPVALERAVGARAQVFEGLRAPLERLEQVLDRAMSSGTTQRITTYELEPGSTDAVEGAPRGPMLDESAFAPFPTS